MKRAYISAGTLFRLLSILAAALLLLCRSELMQEEAYFLLLPLLAFAALSGRASGRDPFLPFKKEGASRFLPSVLFTALFFIRTASSDVSVGAWLF